MTITSETATPRNLLALSYLFNLFLKNTTVAARRYKGLFYTMYY